MENKNDMSKNIIIIILMLMIIGLAGLMCYDKFVVNKEPEKTKIIEKKEETKKEEMTKEEELSLDSEMVKKLYSPFRHHTYEADMEELYSKDIITPNELSNTYRNRLAFAYYFETKAKGNRNNAYDGSDTYKGLFSYSYLLSTTLEKYYKEFFGNNISYIPETFDSYNIDLLTMTYNKSKLRYESDDVAGDASFYRYATQLYKAIQTNKSIELYEYTVVLKQKSVGYVTFFNNINDAKEFKNPGFEIKIESISTLYGTNNEIDLSLNKIQPTVSKYKITFTKDTTGNYYFTKIEKVDK